MIMKKVAYIIPGYGESHLRQSGYNKVAKFFKEQGITPIHVQINWKYKKPARFEDYVKQFLKVYKKPKGTEVYILGFSYGAIIAFLSAVKTKPKALILCSLSPYFKEDQKNLKPIWIKWWRKNFIESDFSFTELASKVKTKTYLIVGNKEPNHCLVRARDAKRKLDARLSIAKGAKHNIGQKEYLQTVKKVILKL